MAKSDNGELNSSIFGSNTTDPNNSLLKKVTKRVSGLFPSSLTKWFGPSDGQSVVRRRDSVDEDEEDTSHIQQPPKKRAKPSSDVDFASTNSFTITSTPLLNSRNDHRHLQPGPSGYTRHSTLSTTTTSLNYDSSSVRNESTVANGDNKSDSGDSTSGYSSVQPQPHKESSFISDKGKTVNLPSTSKTSPNKSLNVSMNSSRSLFSEQSLNPQRQCLSTRRPSFSASTFGSPSFVDRTLSTKRAVNSPFYGGRTMYGGASAYRRNKIIFPRDEAHSVPMKNSIDIKPVKSTSSNNDSVNLSKTARRILDTLEHFSTPVLDAKKIPNINRQSCDINKLSIQRRTSNSREKNSVPNKELLVPTVPDLLKMKLKERLQDSTVKVRKVATTSKSILNTEYSIRTIEETNKPQKHINKMKTKMTSIRDRHENMSDTVDIVKLPEVKLPITKLPEFNFTLPPPPTVAVKSSSSEIIKKVSSATIAKPVATPKTVSAKLNFANPIIVSEKPKSASLNNNFTFSEPINVKSSNTSTHSTTVTFNFNSPVKNTAPRKRDVSKNNGQNNIGMSLQPPTHFVSGSVMDILGKPEKKSETDNLMSKFKPAADTWECNACMIRNIPSATRCIACETLRENPKKSESQNFGFENKFKMPSDKWECSACMVRNNYTDTKCVACTTAKPVAVSGSLSVVSTTNTTNTLSGFGDKFKPASDTWECSVCMVRNKNDAGKCIACETPKPGNKNESKSTLIMACEMKTNSSGFGDLIKKQQTNWECGSCMVRNPPEKNICACCEAPKPGEKHEFKFGIQPTSQFKFGIDNSTNSGFKFGIDNASTATTFSFGVKSVDKTTDVKSTTKNELTPVASGFTFGIPATNKTEDTKESPSKPSVSNTSAISSVNNTITSSIPVSNKTDKSVTSPSNAFSSTTITTMKSSGFNFGVPTNTTQNAETKPSFSFTATSIATSSTNSSVVSSSTTKPISATIIFGNVSSAQPTTSFNATTAATIASPNTTTSSSATLHFGTSTNTKPLPVNSENKLSASQFNFGPGTFNTVQPVSIPAAVTTSATTLGIGNNTTAFSNRNTDVSNKTEISTFGNIQPTFTFSGGSNNKSEMKPFAFIGSGEPAAKIPAFTFSQNATPVAGAPLAKAPVYNFGASSTSGANTAAGTPAPAANLFNFGGHKTEKPVTFGTGNSSVFGDTAQPSTIPQNGGFNFGSSNAPMSFNFGAGNNPTPTSTPAVFGFGSSQAGSGSATAASAPAVPSSGVFTFGNPAAAQQQTPAFSPDIKPNFNFTGGSLPSFTAQSASLTGAMPQRKIRKAVRRTQPR